MDKKKVLFVVHQLNYGGVQKALLSALNAIDYDRYDVTLYVRKARLDLLPEVNPKVSEIIVNDDNTHYYRKPCAVLLLAQMKILTIIGRKEAAEEVKEKLSKNIAEQKIEYEHKKYFTDGRSFDVAVSYIQGYPAKLVTNCVKAERKIMFFHGSTDENHELHESIFVRIDAIVGVNAGVQKVLEGWYPAWKGKMTYLENYVDAEEIRRKANEKIDMAVIPGGGVTDKRIILCTCGRFTTVKGFDLAIRAAAILKSQEIDFVWFFVGDGPERKNMEALVQEYNLVENIVITGMQSNPYLWINMCSIYVQSSYAEAHPLSIIEAQILLKPVVSTLTVGGESLIHDEKTGVLAEISEKSIAEKIMLLSSEKNLYDEITTNLAKINYENKSIDYRKRLSTILRG